MRIGYLQMLRSGIKANSNAICIIQTFAPPPETLFGEVWNRAQPGTLRFLIDRINRELAASVIASGDVLLDNGRTSRNRWARRLARSPAVEHGETAFLGPRNPTLCRPRGSDGSGYPWEEPKALILDLDNTLFGRGYWR